MKNEYDVIAHRNAEQAKIKIDLLLLFIPHLQNRIKHADGSQSKN